MNFGRLELRGANVTLRPLELDDAEAIAAAAAESRETYGFTPVPQSLAGALKYVQRALQAREAGERYAFAIVWHGRVVGSTSYYDYEPWEWPEGAALKRSDRPDAVEIGHTWLAASAQRTACNTETKLALLTHAFETWAVHRVSLRTDARNERSRNAIARIGAKFEGIRRAERAAVDGVVRDSAYYSILIAEWPEVRAALERRLARRSA